MDYRILLEIAAFAVILLLSKHLYAKCSALRKSNNELIHMRKQLQVRSANYEKFTLMIRLTALTSIECPQLQKQLSETIDTYGLER